MRATTFFAAAAALAGSVAASPINKRDIAYVTEYSYVTAYVYTTVAAGSPEATPVSVAPKKEAVVAAVSTPTPTPSAIVITSEAPAPAPVSAAPAPAPEVESSSSAPSSSASLSSGSVSHVPGLSSYAQTVLLHHNAHRANHTAPPLLWSSDLENSAGQVAATCNYEHQMDFSGGGYGQNIAAGPQSSDIGDVLTTMFYNGEVNYFDGQYGQANPDMSLFENFGHFSQMVWAGTTHVACVTQDCSAQGLANVGGDVPPYFTVCNYKGAGNMGGEWATNVLQSIGLPSISGSYSG